MPSDRRNAENLLVPVVPGPAGGPGRVTVTAPAAVAVTGPPPPQAAAAALNHHDD